MDCRVKPGNDDTTVSPLLHYNRNIGRLPFSSRGTFTRASPSSTTARKLSVCAM
jgi:hypothetical protein